MARITAQHSSTRQFSIVTLVLTILLWGLRSQPVLAQDATQQILDAINGARGENGLAPLAINPLLSQAAQNHVNDMITNYVYGHYGSDGSTVQVRVARTGYSATPWVSENWVSASSPAGAMRWWMSDYIHRVNILTARWTEIGIGVGTRGDEMIFVTVFSAGGGASGADAAMVAAGAPPVEAPPPSVHIEQVSVPPEGLDYTVVGGDTLLAIGLRYGLPWERIAEANGLDEHSLLQIGQSLHIPGSGAAAAPAPEVETEDYVVQPNDTLYSIAAQRGMFWDDVAAVNGFGEQTILQIGQVIQVPVVEEAQPEQTMMLANTRRDTVGPVTPEQSPSNFDSYTLMAFDPNKSMGAVTTSMVASTGIGGPLGESSGATVSQVAMAKGPGATSAVLEAHAAAEATAQATGPASPAEAVVAAATDNTVDESVAGDGALYTVQPGDTIISIAVNHGLEWGALLALNGMTENSLLQPGQAIRLR